MSRKTVRKGALSGWSLYLAPTVILLLIPIFSYLNQHGPGSLLISVLMALMFCTLAIIWSVSIAYRILSATIRHCLEAVGVLVTVMISVRIIKYEFIDPTAAGIDRLLWYSYYVFMLGIPLCGLRAALHVSGKDGRKGKYLRTFGLVAGVTILLIGLIMTNDLHQLAFRFKDTPINNNNYSHGGVYFLAVVMIGGCNVAAVLLMLHSMKNQIHRWQQHLPMLPLIGLLVYSLLYLTLGWAFSKYFYLTDAYGTFTILFWESCIRVGLVRTNTEYEAVFSHSSVPAVITDGDGSVVYESAVRIPLTQDMMENRGPVQRVDENVTLCRRKVKGGRVLWIEDRSRISRLKDLLEEQKERLKEEQELLQEEIRTREELAQIRAQNTIYDNTIRRVTPQIMQIRNLLSEENDEETFLKNLSWACALNTYVKRRVNLGLLSMQEKTMSLEQLALAMNESRRYLELCGITTSYFLPAEESIDSKTMMALLDALELVLEKGYPSLDSLLLSMERKDEAVFIRIMAEDADGDDLRVGSQFAARYEDIRDIDAVLKDVGGRISGHAEDDIIYLTIMIPVFSEKERQSD
ncbi:MAG: hypothetical protein HUJ69_03200 [Lachnospiraceae bacterium]|nr:hypothetical protein [Lachnospiraceae bacterium]